MSLVISIAIPLMYAIIFHELAHGWVAYRMGDPTAKLLGRLSLNPLKHLDPVGTIMLFIFGFGWAKPVPVNFNQLRDRRKGMITVSSAGIIANMLLAFSALFRPFYHIRFNNFEEAERIFFKYIEVYYNQRRKHSTNGWKTPAHCEQEWYNLKKVA